MMRKEGGREEWEMIRKDGGRGDDEEGGWGSGDWLEG